MRSFSLLALAATSVTADSKPTVDPIPVVGPLVAGERELTFDLAKKALPGENAVFSPASVHVALGMTYGGARGTTADEMAKVLHLAAGNAVHDQFAALLASLAKLEHKDQSFHMANRLYAETKYPWNAEYLALTDKKYGAGLEPVRFADAEPVRQRINSWVAGQTHDKIKELLPKGSLDADTRMVLTNAVYFKGAWLHQFDKAETAPAAFHVRGAAATAQVSTMHQTERFALGGDASAQILEMPYAHGDLAMDVILPRAVDGLAAVEGKLDGAGLVKLLGTMKPTMTEVAMPSFKVRTAVELKKLFQELGMKAPFARTANFDGMVQKRLEPLFIDQIYHQGFVELDERGTEAAAATAVVMTTESARMPPKGTPFTVDHPFIWLIRDTTTGEVLFYGRVVDPSKS